MPVPAKKILCVPFDAILGNTTRNRARVLELAHDLAGAGHAPDVVVLPELALSGYLLESLVSEVAMTRDELAGFAAELTTSGLAARIEWVMGVALREGAEIYNAAAVLCEGKILHIQKKLFLPTYGMFDEGRYFKRGSDFTVYDGALGRCGILICEDAWHPELAYAASERGADTVLVISSSPARGYESGGEVFDSTLMWRNRLQVFSQSYGQNYVYCNRSGVEDGVLYDGTNFALDGAARFVAGEAQAAAQKAVLYEHNNATERRTGFGGNSSRQNDLPLILSILSR